MGAAAMLAAGGTAGHLFPAFALAQELGRRGISVDLVTDMRGDRYGAGFPARNIYRVPAATFASRSPVAAARTLFTLARGTLSAHGLMGRVKPATVVGFGGYPTIPPLTAARLRGIPTILHEQNAVLGRANRLLSRGVSAIATSFSKVRLLDGALRDKARLTGNPVRDAVLQNAGRLYAASRDGEPFRLLVFGGSQGARFFSDAVPPALVRLPEELRRRLRVTQQCREEDLERVEDRYEAHGIKAELATFFKDLPERMASSHLVMARAGASSVAELAVLGVPSVLVPLPHALDNDQLQNATQLAEAGACWAVEQRTLTETGLAELMARLMASPEELEKAAAAARNQGRGDAAVRLADLVEEFMGLRASGGARDLASERAHAPARLSGGH
jgi:UDP-N-acetylglucosamine--N-acetylmuramyl-(pentapeptide) pyrophosphoryl-undecaprenol N-acetylglucosamine transferase